MLKVKNLEVYYGKIHAVKGISFHVNQGELVVLLGSNGAGKTSTLSAIMGIVKASSGSIKFEGKEITSLSPEEIVRNHLSFVPEGRKIFKPMTVEENLKIAVYHWHGKADRAEVEEALAQVYQMFPILKSRRKQLAGTLSGGEQQMLALGMALLTRPQMLILDEPSMGLAPKMRQEIFQYILALRKELGLTVLLVEQNVKSALKIADRGYVLENGRIILEGSSEELLENREVQRAYLGRIKEDG